MNLIEIWHKSPSAKIKNSFGLIIEFAQFGNFSDVCKNLPEHELLDCTWEIVKEKKKVVIEDVCKCTETLLLDNSSQSIARKAPDNIKIKVTLEWEE